jgi:hypothetical protein
MKRIAMATVALTALAVGAQAGGLPKPIRLVERMKMYSPTHYVRGAESGGGGGGSQSTTAEARQETTAPKPADQPKQDPKPAKAD